MSKLRRFLIAVLVLLGSVLTLPRCASIAHGRFQQVPVISTPAGADVTADCGLGAKPVGQTPVVVKVSRKPDRCVITVKKDGYQDESIILRRHVSGWVWGNVFLPYAVPGVLVDLFDGAAYRRAPANVDLNLRQQTASQ